MEGMVRGGGGWRKEETVVDGVRDGVGDGDAGCGGG